jgi:hypothetical protein
MIRGGGFLVPFADVQEAFLRRQIQWRHFTDEFPVIGSKIPVLRNNFPVNWSRELLLSDYSAALSCTKNVFRSLKIVEFTAKFPDSREISWRRVRSALQRQPAFNSLNQALLAFPDFSF